MIKVENGVFKCEGTGLEITLDLMTLFDSLEKYTEEDKNFARSVKLADDVRNKATTSEERADLLAEIMYKHFKKILDDIS